jgi:hypothetical protein
MFSDRIVTNFPKKKDGKVAAKRKKKREIEPKGNGTVMRKPVCLWHQIIGTMNL